MTQPSPAVPQPPRPGDFYKYWVGQTVSNFGSSITGFALPLIVYKLTGSALNLGIATAVTFLPYVLFGLVLGAWADRVDRKRLMIGTDVVRGVLIASVPLLAVAGWLPVWWLYLVGFLQTTLTIAFDACQFAALPALVGRDNLVTANGRVQASYALAGLAGPLLAGLLVSVLTVDQLLWLDAASFGFSALSLALVAARFNVSTPGPPPKLHLGRDIKEGLRYVWGHPVLRNISLMMALVNFFAIMVGSQLVAYAKEQLGASDDQVIWLFAAESAGMMICSLLAGKLSRRWRFSPLILGALMLSGLAIGGLALTTTYWAALLFFGLSAGASILFNINTASLRQAIVPDHLLGRVQTSGRVLAWSAIPLGALVGGWAIGWTHNVGLVFGLVGLATIAIPLAFAFTALGHADRYLPAPDAAPAVVQEQAA